MDAYETLDLTLREGVMAYIETILLPDVRKAFEKRRALQPFGVALATKQGNAKLPRPRVVTVGEYGMGLRNTKRGLRQMVEKTGAVGAILVQLTETTLKSGVGIPAELVLVQLEHNTFGNHVWYARIRRGKMAEWEGPLSVDDVDWNVTATKFLPQRWMN